MSTIDTNRFREALLEERKRVQGAIDHLHDERARPLEDDVGERPYDNHLGDAASETLDREVDESLEENSDHILSAIDSALKRIDDGTYGICTNCGKPISEERLEAMPWAELCIDDQRKLER
jgi:RNA polymerase-binding protein DksA